MFKVSKRDLAAPSPMIAGFYILQIKGIRWVCNDIFENAFRSFDLEDTDPEKGQTLVPVTVTTVCLDNEQNMNMTVLH